MHQFFLARKSLRQEIVTRSLVMAGLLVAAACGSNATTDKENATGLAVGAEFGLETRPPGTRSLLKNGDVASHVEERTGGGKISLNGQGKLVSSLPSSSSNSEKRAETWIADGLANKEFGFGYEISAVAGPGKIWQLMGPPWNLGYGESASLSVNTNGDYELRIGSSSTILGKPTAGAETWYFHVKFSSSGFLRAYKNGQLMGKELRGDVMRGRTGAKIRVGRYNRNTRSASATFDKFVLDGVPPF